MIAALASTALLLLPISKPIGTRCTIFAQSLRRLEANATRNFEVQLSFIFQVCENFDDMGLREDLLRGIFAYGFEKPSAIQQRGTLPLIKGRDTIAQVSRLFVFHAIAQHGVLSRSSC